MHTDAASRPGDPAALRREVESVLLDERISVFFQPVVSVRARGIIGFEAFSRSMSESGARLDARNLFGMDWEPELRLKLCRLCRRKALEAFLPIFERHPNMQLFLNTDGAAVRAAKQPGHLETISQAMGIPGKRIVIELERPCLNTPEVARFVAYYRERGFIISIDGLSSMDMPTEEFFALRPDYIKFDRLLYADVDGNEFKRDVVQSLTRMAERLGSILVAKNVETEEEAVRLLSWGVTHQQGYYYTKDHDSGERDPIRAFQAKVEQINRKYRDLAQQGVAARRKQFEELQKELKKAAYKLAECPQIDFAAACERLAAAEELLLSACVLNEEGIQITPRQFKRSLAPDTSALGPERGRGEDHGIRDDILHLKSGFEKFVCPPVVSPFTKTATTTISARFYNKEGSPYILCLEFLCA